MYDVIVVGGNAIGLHTAKLLGDAGLDVLVLEEHDSIGEPLQCSGLYSSNIERFFRLPESVIQNRISHARLHSRSAEVVLRKGGVSAYVVDRIGLEKWLSKQVKSDILTNTRVSRIRINGCAAVFSGKRRFRSEVVVGCDGHNSVVASHFGIRPKEAIAGLMAVTEESNHDDFVDLWFDKDLIRDGFFWKIPRGETTEYGALGRRVSFRGLEGFFRLRKYNRHAGVIPLGGVRKSHFNRALLVGDSAAQVKPWSGGGMVYGLYCSALAVAILKKAFERNDFSEDALEGYEMWRHSIGRNIALGMTARRLLKRMDNRMLDASFRIAGSFSLSRLDMDFVFRRPW